MSSIQRRTFDYNTRGQRNIEFNLEEGIGVQFTEENLIPMRGVQFRGKGFECNLEMREGNLISMRGGKKI